MKATRLDQKLGASKVLWMADNLELYWVGKMEYSKDDLWAGKKVRQKVAKVAAKREQAMVCT